MNILHICNDFSYSKVYKNLYQEFDKIGLRQIIYHPLRNSNNVGKNTFSFQVEGSTIIYSKFILKKYHRILFTLKIYSIFKDLKKQIDLSKIDILYPTTLFSDGAVAYKIFKKYGIPYVVAVRNTDVNTFLRFRPDLIPLAYKILKNAKNIIFISEGLRKKFFESIYFVGKKDLYDNKTLVVSNGIDDYWLENLKLDNNIKKNSLLFIGRFDYNKNAETVIKCLGKLRLDFPDIQLNLVGGGGNNAKKIELLILKNKDWIRYHGFISDKEKLRKIFSENKFFVMPSIFETFGLVYIEALSQGLPVLYTKNQGIDGLFGREIGESTFPDEKSVKSALFSLMKRSDYKIGEVCFENYRWSNIARRYFELFKK
jgi:glycosyltransferase involved in cell wall biosynthesis